MAQRNDSRKSGVGVADAARDLVKAMGRFSLGMGLFAAREATRLISAPASQAAASLDEVTDSASTHLTGITKTAFAVGTNLQHGLVDAAFDAVGLGKKGQEPTGPTTGLAMSLTTRASRRVKGVRTVASGALDRSVPQAELVRRLTEYQEDATATDADCGRLVDDLWKSEGLATTIAKHQLPENTLKDAALPRQVLPVLHVGFGSGASEHFTFDAGKLKALFTERCVPEYRDFAYEGAGAILRAYERGLLKLLIGTLGLVPLDAPDGPEPAGFFADYLEKYPPRVQRVIAHGYGRILAFSSTDIYEAIKEATTFPQERIEPVVHGAAFAFAMINSADLPQLLRQSAVPFQPNVRAAFQNGLIYALLFMEWYAPGLLARWEAEGRLETDLIEHARREAALDAERGFPLVARLEHPRT